MNEEVILTILSLLNMIDYGIIIKLVLATLVGLCIGRERKRHEKSGGGRTMALVCLGSCFITLLSLKLVAMYNFDFTRLMQGALQGMSIICMGVIFKHRNNVEGLTTASTLFVLMLIGFAVGLGFIFLATIAAILTYCILESKYKQIKKVRRRKRTIKKVTDNE